MHVSYALTVLLIAGSAVLGPGMLWAQTRIDLSVDSAQVNVPRSSQNQKVEITASIRNNGSEAAADADLEVEVFRDGVRVRAFKNVPVLSRLPRNASGQGIPIPLGNLAPGYYEALVRVDPDNRIQETDEVNNVKKISFYVSEPID